MNAPTRVMGLGAPILALAVLAALAGCVSAPAGPRVTVMPPPGKPFDLFEADDRLCRGYAARSAGQSANAAGAGNLIASAALGAALGAVTGAAWGGHEAAVQGAGVGLATGTAYGVGVAGQAQGDAQRRYDIAYEQCMYSRGNQVPSASGYRQPEADYPPADYPAPRLR